MNQADPIWDLYEKTLAFGQLFGGWTYDGEGYFATPVGIIF